MTITETQKTAQLAADAAVSAAEAKQYMLEAEQGYQDTSAAAQQAQDAAGSALLSKQSAATSEENSLQYATEAGVARDEAVASASTAAEFGDNKLTFADTTAGLAGTTSGQYFRVPQGVGNVLAFRYYKNNSGVAVEVAEYVGQGSISNSVRQYATLLLAQNDVAAGNILNGSKFWVTNTSDITLADEYINNSGTPTETGRNMPSQEYVDLSISQNIIRDEDQNLFKHISSDAKITEVDTESGDKFITGMDESLQEMASRSGKDNTTNLISATDKNGAQLIITDADGKIRIPLSDFTLQDLLAQVQPVSGPFLNTLSAADKAAYGYIDELGGLNLPGVPTSVNNMLNSLSRRLQQQADSRFLTSIKDYGWDPSSQDDARQVIQRAIRDMARNTYGGVIYLPPGVYRLSSFLTPAPNVSIIGAGTGKTILMPYGSYSALQFTTSPTNLVPELTDFVYSDFEVDCQDQVLPDEGYLPRTKGLYFNFYRRGHLHRLRVRNSGATGIGIDFARDSAITECVVENFGRLAPSGNDNPAGASGLGLGAGGTQSEPLYVAGNFCRNGKNFGIFLEKQHGTNAPYSSEHTIIMGNTCTGNNGGMGDCGVDGMIMIGNNFSENNYGVVISPGTVLAYPGSRGRLQGNIIAKNAKHGVYYNSTTEQRDGEYQIDGNTIRDNGEDGINFKAPGQEVRSMFIQGNDVYRNGRHGFHLEDGTAINMDVVNNRFWNNGLTASGNGINLASEVRMSSFSGNKIRDIQTIPTQQYPVKAAGALTDVDISFNHCVGNAQNTLNLTGTQTRVTTLNNPGI
ncbi:right-handed parallel beta-helix repeat-containing protein [Klebsiella pasteurii]|uniref:right-handed parallel beta-helix repeat-containing protein n=1 Tax=Klebsiella pasteurii TaxID=2587529 RepID=UPI00287DEC63|nr:glycosyl hydrolase family 28-related protein [Klebsiella pasteurii]MDS7875112.1 glycosyl hydrolase family 28-related protein [Klebsiella pasteurii]